MVEIMEIKVNGFVEQEDGSAICNLDMDNEAKEFLINQGFIKILTEGLSKFELEFKDDASKIFETSPQEIKLDWQDDTH